MKGNTSAGQRVLASVVIRIALAKTFSEKCPIISLDEPTTNLDREHVKRLASFLKTLIYDSEDGFQFLIITHDKEFLRMMKYNYQDAEENYYEITKNPVNRCSEIEMKPLVELGV